MKIKLLVSRSGADGAQNVGDIIDVANDEAGRMIEAGQAEAVRGSKKATTSAATGAAENTSNA